MLKKIYLSFFGYPISLLMNFFGFFSRPFMIYGYWNIPTNSFRKFTRYSSSTVFLQKSKVNIGDNCWIGPNCIIDGSSGISIGKGSQLAGFNAIFTHSSHISIRLCGEKYISLNPDQRLGYIQKPVVIGDFSFIGVSSVILPGVTVGKGCIIAAGSVLKKSIPDFSIAAGNPAKLIGSTLDMDQSYFDKLTFDGSYFDPQVIASHRNKKPFKLEA
jgi:acetyltransferase-like isoleucine patch superfamily enzyme